MMNSEVKKGSFLSLFINAFPIYLKNTLTSPDLKIDNKNLEIEIFESLKGKH